MRKLILLLAIAFAGSAYAQNVKVVNPDTQPVPTKIVSGTISASATAATNLTTSQVTATGTPGTAAIARPTRRQVTFFNQDATNAVFAGPATVTAGNGVKIPAGQSRTFRAVGLIQVIAPTGSPIVDVQDEYD